MKDDPHADLERRTHGLTTAVVQAPSAPAQSAHESHAACPSRQLQSRSAFLSAARSRAQTLQHRTDNAWINVTFQTDPHLAWQLNMDRTTLGRLNLRRLRLAKLRLAKLGLLRDADRKQLDRLLSSHSELAVTMQTPPLKHLVRVHAILQRHPCHRSPGLQRLLHNPPPLHRTPPTTRTHHQPTAHFNISHLNIITAEQPEVHAANTGRLRTTSH